MGRPPAIGPRPRTVPLAVSSGTPKRALAHVIVVVDLWLNARPPTSG